MRALIICGCAVLLLVWQQARTACAGETAGPDAFASELVATMQYGASPDDGELLDLWLSHFNETDPALRAEAVCYAPVVWAWPAFIAEASYSATDDYGAWDVELKLAGVLDLDQLVELNGVDYPSLASLDAYYFIEWHGKDGSSFISTWGYTLLDIPPVACPSGELFAAGAPDGLPADRLTYSLAASGKLEVTRHLDGLYYFYSTADPNFPESAYEFETDGKPARELNFNLILYYSADTTAPE